LDKPTDDRIPQRLQTILAEVTALRDITLSVKKGELVFLAGLPAPASPRC
jgi:ABC-type ATPase involved in cell division